MAGLIFTTRGWTGAEITWTHAAGADTFSVSDAGFGDAANAYDVARALAAWLVDYSPRPWNSTQIATATMSTRSDGARVAFDFAFTGSDTAFTISGNAVWNGMFGNTAQVPTAPALGTLSTSFANVNWYRRDREAGTKCRNGSWRMGHQLYTARRPSVSDRLTLAEVYALNEALRYAAQPRDVYLYSVDEWRLCTVGKVDIAPVDDDSTMMDVELELLQQTYDPAWSGIEAGL